MSVVTVLTALLALLVDRAFGYPDRLYRAVKHPVVWIGNLIGVLDRHMNRPHQVEPIRRLQGILALLMVLGAVTLPVFAVQTLLYSIPFGFIVAAFVASSLIAQRSLDEHVGAVASALEEGGIAQGRKAVSMIVGRDPDSLDEAGVARAAIESLAENFSDGVVAPAFWLCIGGLPGIAAYKAVNTADSMIGHMTPRHRAFGWAAARLDDLVNLPASRLTALLLVAAAVTVPEASVRRAWRSMREDAPKHRSPNAGWPEAAMAGALGLALAGPRQYGGTLLDDAVMGAGGRRDATAADIRLALRLYRTADAILICLVALLAAGIIVHGR